jgi:hypothetical protein
MNDFESVFGVNFCSSFVLGNTFEFAGDFEPEKASEAPGSSELILIFVISGNSEFIKDFESKFNADCCLSVEFGNVVESEYDCESENI